MKFAAIPIFCIFVASLFWSGGFARADDASAVPVRTIAAFADVRMQLQALVNIFGFHDKNEFCVVAYEGTGGLQAEIYWPTQNKLIQWIPNGTRAVLNSFYYRDLTRDVAVTDHDIASDDPNPRLTRADADEMI